MRMCDPHGVVAATTHAPRRHLPLLHPFLLLNPIQHTAPQSIRTRGIVGISGTIARPRDFDPDRRPAVRDVVVGRIDVLGPIAVQAVNLQHGGEPFARGVTGHAYGHGDKSAGLVGEGDPVLG